LAARTTRTAGRAAGDAKAAAADRASLVAEVRLAAGADATRSTEIAALRTQSTAAYRAGRRANRRTRTARATLRSEAATGAARSGVAHPVAEPDTDPAHGHANAGHAATTVVAAISPATLEAGFPTWGDRCATCAALANLCRIGSTVALRTAVAGIRQIATVVAGQSTVVTRQTNAARSTTAPPVAAHARRQKQYQETTSRYGCHESPPGRQEQKTMPAWAHHTRKPGCGRVAKPRILIRSC